MATMLGYLFTNAHIEAPELDAMLRRCVERTFNAISVDSDTSTSDTVALMSTSEVELPEAHVGDFEHALLMLCAKLARDVVGQGEGVENLIEVEVGVETSVEDARSLAKALINSPLVKTAVHGADPNWGRIVMAIGKPAARASFARIDPGDLEIWLMDEKVFDRGRALDVDLDAMSLRMQRQKTARIRVEIGSPRHWFKAWGCDLTHEYIHINADYTT
jgi:glutamate N-acetyltransferase/amino-acid N-acetyltransferase